MVAGLPVGRRGGVGGGVRSDSAASPPARASGECSPRSSTLERVFDSGVQETLPIFFSLLSSPFLLPPAEGDRCDDTVSFGFACGRELFVFACYGRCLFQEELILGLV